MYIEKEIKDLKGEIDRIDASLEEIGLLLNSRKDLDKLNAKMDTIILLMETMSKDPGYHVKLFKRRVK